MVQRVLQFPPTLAQLAVGTEVGVTVGLGLVVGVGLGTTVGNKVGDGLAPA